jgi:hypothetical protein
MADRHAFPASQWSSRQQRRRTHALDGRDLRTPLTDPRRSAILLIGGDKTGDDRFYERMIPIADELYDVHLQELKQEGLLK